MPLGVARARTEAESYGASRKDVKMPKDTKKVVAARSRSRMGGKQAKAAGRVKAVLHAVRDVLSERQTARRNQRQKGKTGRRAAAYCLRARRLPAHQA